MLELLGQCWSMMFIQDTFRLEYSADVIGHMSTLQAINQCKTVFMSLIIKAPAKLTLGSNTHSC